MRKNLFAFGLIFCLIISTRSQDRYVNKSQTKPWKTRYYPIHSLFLKEDLIDKGCVVFILACPQIYKQTMVCGRHYDGKYKTFNNYCELEYENCNSWRQWSMIKNGRC